MASVTIRVADAMRTSGYLPVALNDCSTAVKAKLLSILATQPPPITAHAFPLESAHVSVWLPAAVQTSLTALGSGLGLTVGEAANTLLLQDFAMWQAQTAANVLPESVPTGQTADNEFERRMLAAGKPIRSEQRKMYNVLQGFAREVQTPRVLMCEAGTGIGKTLAYLGHVLEEQTSGRCGVAYIAAPTFALTAQIRESLEMLRPDCAAVYLAGQSEWVSESALADLCTLGITDGRITQPEADELEQLVRTWRGQSPCTATPWRMESLLLAVPGFKWSHDVSVQGRLTDADAGYLAYRAQFAAMRDAQIVVLTHRMLGQLFKLRFYRHLKSLKASGTDWFGGAISRWQADKAAEAAGTGHGSRVRFAFEYIVEGMAADLDDSAEAILPTPDLLVIDEAHLFEDIIASVFSTYVSMHTLKRDVNALHAEFPAAFADTSAQRLAEVAQIMRGMADERDTDDAMDLSDRSDMLSGLAQALETAVQPKPRTSKSVREAIKQHRVFKQIAQVLYALRCHMEARPQQSASYSAYLHWSPKRGYARLTLGKLYLNRELHYFWTVVAPRSVLVSGTLYQSMPQLSCESIRRGLLVPPEALLTMQPIHARWQIDPVTVCMVAARHDLSGRERFTRPRYDSTDELAHQNWIDDCANYLGQAAATAAGGMLVLCTSYRDAAALEPRLLETVKLVNQWTLLVQEPGQSLSGLRQQFLTESRKGPVILVATGAAWTGFDLYDPELPDALTDVAILNAPFGLATDTLTRLRRRAEKTGFYEVSISALTLVRQAVGRLIRSPQTAHNRRIHWLDARQEKSEMVGFFSPIRRFLMQYRTITV